MKYESAKTPHGNVGVSYVSQTLADEQAQEMEVNNCWACSGCSRCSGCSDCSRCSGCSDCSRCSGCSDCSRCSGCSDCSRCSDCSDCSGCSRCSGFYNGELKTTPEQAIANLDKVSELILDKPERLVMTTWHENEEWKGHTCIEEHICGTTHCLAGHLQICSDDSEIRELPAEIAGAMMAPCAAHLFYRENEEVMAWLKNRDYAK